MKEQECMTEDTPATEDTPEKGLIKWIKEHKVQLVFAGVSVTAVIVTILGLKNKDALTEIWKSLQKEIKKGSLYSEKWFKTADLEELEEARARIQQDYRNPELDMEYRGECWDLLSKFDKIIGERKWKGKDYGYPAHSEHGWYLSGDD